MYYRLHKGDNKGIFQLSNWHRDIPYCILDLGSLHPTAKYDGKKLPEYEEGHNFYFTEKAIGKHSIKHAIEKVLEEKEIKLIKVENLQIAWEGKSGLQVWGKIPTKEQLLLPFIERG